MTEDQGASANELMLALCRGDQEEELEKLLDEGHCDVSFVDGAGNSAAHYAAKSGSIGCLEVLVNHDEVDLDIQNTLEGATPLHLAVQYANQDHEMAAAMVELLLAGGANPKIQNRNQLTPAMLVNPQYKDIKQQLDSASVAYDMDDSDIAHDDDMDDSGSASEEE
ncbi:ankyrin repeat-containing domain protein [Gilbertella persicaria]|uniref:ankyrin repeat-containing domain protein n=1 Tax=Gilbertella persicaria TaxID=101096 RepID=UPI002220D9D3|nr:ankyrin repeat-containing domain protein [Gilbertella persicaria]KAI8059963.1 ankyrin repeat-containing domain protein [Gilbertella persicaria]